MLDNFQLNADYAERIQDKAISEFGKNACFTDLVKWLQNNLRLICTEEQIDDALRGQRSEYKVLNGLCTFGNVDSHLAILSMPYNSIAPRDVTSISNPPNPHDIIPADVNSRVRDLQSTQTIDQLVDEICLGIKFSFEDEERYSSAAESNPDWIEKNFIDLDVIEVEYLPSQYPAVLNKEDLQNGGQSDDDFDRLNIRLLHGKKTTSRKLLDASERVFIYGDPGAGKSSYLRWVALNCRNRNLLQRYVPLFLEVRNFPVWGTGQSLTTYFESTFEQRGINPSALARVISAGRGFFILDGIDEIKKDDYRRLEKMIRALLINDNKCRFLISSRLGFNFQFPNLKKVIISPFHSSRHIPAFVRNWFNQANGGKPQANMMLEKFSSLKYRGIREIARRPVLLRLLCILFERDNDFPIRRADVFQQGISALIQQSSQEYFDTNINDLPELRPHDVTNILCRVAHSFFVEMNGDTLFHTNEVKNIILNYYSLIYKIHRSQVDPEHILNSIERYNGLLVRWAPTFCSFSHLTYQEYFVAQHLVYENKQDEVYDYLQNPHWQFITELVAELLPQEKIIDFLKGFKFNVDTLVNQDEKVRNFLEELSRAASLAIHASEKANPFMQVLIRAWYLVYAIGEDTSKIDGSLPKPDTYNLPDMFYATSMVSNDILDLHSVLYESYHCTIQDDSRRLTAQINKLIKLFESKDSRRVDTLKSWLGQIDYQLARFDGDKERWWADKNVRQKWRRNISYLMESLRVPCIMTLSPKQIRQLKDYYTATHLFSTCINRSAIDDSKRKEMANSMLLVEHYPPDGGDDFFNI